MRRLNVVVAVLLLLGALVISQFLAPGLRAREKPNWLKCRNNLRQVALAANQYADEKRFYPHVAKLTELDGGVESPTAARAFRTLAYFNYQDQPESFICPSSHDVFEPLDDKMRQDIRVFGWKGPAKLWKDVSPLYQENNGDLPLVQMTNLSYGWTRRGLTPNSRGESLLAGDKACLLESKSGAEATDASHRDNMIGNHRDWMQAATVDGRVVRFDRGPVEDAWNIAGTSGDAGFLGVLPDADVRTASDAPPKEPFRLEGAHFAGIGVVLILGGLALSVIRNRPRTGPLGEPL